MENEKKYYSQFDKYLKNTFSDTEKANFEKKLNEDNNLKEEYQLYSKMVTGVKTLGDEKLYNKLDDFHDSFGFDKEQKSTWKKWVCLLMTILFIGIIAYSLGAFKSNEEDVLQKYTKPPVLAFVQRDAIENATERNIINLWQEENYSQIIPVLENHSGGSDYTLALAYSYFSESQYPEAEEKLQQIIKSDDILYIDQARFYLALVYLRTDQKKKAGEELKAISNRASKEMKNAVEVLLSMTY